MVCTSTSWGIVTPHKNLPGVHGDGLYLKRGSSIYNGEGLLLGSTSPFKNIPILNLLLCLFTCQTVVMSCVYISLILNLEL